MNLSKPPQYRHLAVHYETDHWIGHSTGALGGPGWDGSSNFHAPAQEMIDTLVDLYDQLYQSVDFGYGDLYNEAVINIGSAAIDRASTASAATTYVDETAGAEADGTGIIDTITVFMA